MDGGEGSVSALDLQIAGPGGISGGGVCPWRLGTNSSIGLEARLAFAEGANRLINTLESSSDRHVGLLMAQNRHLEAVSQGIMQLCVLFQTLL